MFKKDEGGRSQGGMQTVARESNSVTSGWHNVFEEGGGREVLTYETLGGNRNCQTHCRRNCSWALHFSWYGCFPWGTDLTLLKPTANTCWNSLDDQWWKPGFSLWSGRLQISRKTRMNHVVSDEGLRHHQKAQMWILWVDIDVIVDMCVSMYTWF